MSPMRKGCSAFPNRLPGLRRTSKGSGPRASDARLFSRNAAESLATGSSPAAGATTASASLASGTNADGPAATAASGTAAGSATTRVSGRGSAASAVRATAARTAAVCAATAAVSAVRPTAAASAVCAAAPTTGTSAVSATAIPAPVRADGSGCRCLGGATARAVRAPFMAHGCWIRGGIPAGRRRDLLLRGALRQ